MLERSAGPCDGRPRAPFRGVGDGPTCSDVHLRELCAGGCKGARPEAGTSEEREEQQLRVKMSSGVGGAGG